MTSSPSGLSWKSTYKSGLRLVWRPEMAPGPKATLLVLSEDERAALERIARRRKAGQALATRARVVLACAEPGATNMGVARALGVSRPTVATWRARFAAHRMDGLDDAPRSGAPRKVGDDEVERLVALTLDTQPEGATHWFTRDCKRNGTLDLFAALDIKTGRVIGSCKQRHRVTEFRAFLDQVEAAVPDDLDVYLVLDNAATHKTRIVQDWLVKRPRWHMHFTPTSASWLGMVEGWLALLTHRQLQRGAFANTDALEAAINAYMARTNADPKPFVWTKSAAAILASVARFCHRTSNSDHQRSRHVGCPA